MTNSKLLMSATAWGTIVANVLFAVITPDDILAGSRFLSNLTGTVATYIPSVDNLTHLSKFPEVTRFVLSVAWLLAIVVFVIYTYAVLKVSVPEKTIGRLRRTRIIMTLIAYIFIPALIGAAIYLIGTDLPREDGGLPGELLVRAAGESRIILGFLAAMLSMMVGVTCMFIVYWTSLLPKLFGRDKHTR